MSPETPPTRLVRLTTEEVCGLVRISRATLWRRIAQGRLPKPIDRGRSALFSADEVMAALTRPAPADPVAREGHQALAQRRWPGPASAPRRTRG